MKQLIGLSNVAIGLFMLGSVSSFALPTCPVVPGSEFGTIYNLFNSAVVGPTSLKAKSGCSFANISTGGFYELDASTNAFQIFDQQTWFSGGNNALIQILVPSQGDYVTADTCASPTISSDVIVSNAEQLKISQDDNGLVTIVHGNQSCQLIACPEFGACN